MLVHIYEIVLLLNRSKIIENFKIVSERQPTDCLNPNRATIKQNKKEKKWPRITIIATAQLHS